MSTFDPQKLVTIAENQKKVYDAGAENVEKILTNGGERNYYYNFFRQCDFEYPPFLPSNIVNARAMFYDCANLKEIKGLDLSKATSLHDMFANTSSLEKVLNSPTPMATNIQYMFMASGVKEINPLNVSSVGTAPNNSLNAFSNCKNLITVVMEGTIPFSMDIHWSPLSKASILSIINALSDTASGQTLTLSKSAKEATFSDTEWAELIATKPNWSVSLA